MRNPISVFTLVLFSLALAALSQQPDDSVQHAATTVAALHDSMLDPASFVLDGAYVTKPIHRLAEKDRRDMPTYCYAFRSRNPMGGYSDGRAYEDPLNHGHLTIVQPSSGGAFMGYDTGWVAPCKAKNIDRNITADVAPLAPPLYQKSR